MAITESDIKLHLTGAASDGGTQTDPNSSFGNYKSSTAIINDSDENLFDDVSGDEASTGDTEYRCYCIRNEHGSLDFTDAKIYLSDAVIGGTNSVEFAVEVPATANLTDGNAQTIANESTPPASINTTNHNGVGSGISAWSTATTKSTGIALSLGAHDADLGVNEVVFVWVKRIIAAGAAAASAVAMAITIEGETAA
ncbi:MAG: hypothetical protein GY845_03405 [Planctomycetes bacterium]|nr:hypothetical protein [Planctomycetota bacterium]